MNANHVFGFKEMPTKMISDKNANRKMIAVFLRPATAAAVIALEDRKTETTDWHTEVYLIKSWKNRLVLQLFYFEFSKITKY